MRIEKQRSRVGGADRWYSLAGGGALVYFGLSRKSWWGAAFALLGADFLARGITGDGHLLQVLNLHMPWDRSLPYGRGIKLRRSVVINRPIEELYRFWRNFENLQRFMGHVKSVRTVGENRSHWVVEGPAGTNVEWDAEITVERENEIIGWRSLPGAMIDNAGSVRFERAAGDRGTIVRVQLQYNAPAGDVGYALARLFGEEPEQEIAADLRRFKQLMEIGEVPTTTGQPSGREEEVREHLFEATEREEALRTREAVQEASEESFPASDAPAWTAGGGGGN